MKRLFALFLFVCLAWLGVPARSSIPPAPRQWVTDEAGFLAPGTKVGLNAELKQFQELTGYQVVVWIGQTIGTASLDDWSTETFRKWRIGEKGKDNGVALFILSKDRKVRIESGYGVEGKLPDLIVSRIIRDILVPGFKSGRRDQAVTDAVAVILKALDAKAASKVSSGAFPVAAQRPVGSPRGRNAGAMSVGKIIFLGIIGLLFLFLLITHPALAMLLLFSFVSGGGGGGGGAGGGFSGGGGLSGGGGASGSW